MTKKFNPKNPRFVWNIGSIREVYPDMPEQNEEMVLWDRQERKAVCTVASDYVQAMCLETTTTPTDAPFTNLEEWFNSLKNREMTSENLKPTR